MRQSVHHVYRLCLFFISLILAVSCHKGFNTPDGINDKVYIVRFNIQNVESYSANKASGSVLLQRSSTNRNSQTSKGYLYYWSFNNENLIPDIALHAGSQLGFESNNDPVFTFGGWAFDTYEAGQSASTTGLKNAVLKLPLSNAISLDDFGFDVSSSGTGPKAVRVSISSDGVDWTVRMDSTDFFNVNTSQYRNSYQTDFSSIDLNGLDTLWIRIEALSGPRGGSDYSPNSGVARLDNVYLKGISTGGTGGSSDKLAYYIFHKTSGELVASEELDFDGLSLDVSLQHGRYDVVFVRNHSDRVLILPSGIQEVSQFYFSNYFSNAAANVYAGIKELVVNDDLQENVTLTRAFSQIKFQFTDSRDLSEVSRIVITPLHEPFFFAPFNSAMTNPVVDQESVEFEPDFSTSKEIQFNQFMGFPTDRRTVSYRVVAYGSDDKVLKTIEVSSSILNNIQLVFKGELLNGLPFTAGFQIQINEDWDGEEEVGF